MRRNRNAIFSFLRIKYYPLKFLLIVISQYALHEGRYREEKQNLSTPLVRKIYLLRNAKQEREAKFGAREHEPWNIKNLLDRNLKAISRQRRNSGLEKRCQYLPFGGPNFMYSRYCTMYSSGTGILRILIFLELQYLFFLKYNCF